MQPDPTDVKSGRLAGCDLAPSAAGTAKWRLRPPKKRHFAPFFSTFLMIFSGFFCELAQEGPIGANVIPKALVLTMPNRTQTRAFFKWCMLPSCHVAGDKS